MCISVHQLCYVHADKEPLFQNINLIVNTGQRLALVGNNGTGKSTLLRIIEGNLKPSSGGGSVFFTPLLYSTTFRTVRQPDCGGSSAGGRSDKGAPCHS